MLEPTPSTSKSGTRSDEERFYVSPPINRRRDLEV